MEAFRQVLREDLKHPIYLTPEEVGGGWCDLFPALATSLPAPFPIFGRDEEKVVTWGYPLLLSDGVLKLRRDLEALVTAEMDCRTQPQTGNGDDKQRMMAQRERYHKSISATLENVFMNDYHRGLVDLFLLFHSGEVCRALSKVPKTRPALRGGRGRPGYENHRQGIATIIADLLRRAALTAVDRLRKLAEVQVTPTITPLLGIICQDQLLLVESRTPTQLSQLTGFLQARFRQKADAVETANREVLERLRDVVARRPEVGKLLRLAVGSNLKLDRPETLLEPRLLDAIHTSGLADTILLSRIQMDLLRDLGLRLKTFELLAALRRRVLPMRRQGTTLTLAGPSSATPIAKTTRPYDFTAPGVVDSSVRRFGLIYDLSNFTTVLEEVRKAGRMAEERALQFMYIFQNRLEAIRLRRRLTFEKFLGDGAFYTSRRALRVIAAACEIQQVYEQLRGAGFPFNHGIRIAVNYGVFRLLPMLHPGPGTERFEFFGHGIVELARLTTGKSTREISDIAEFLVHSGYDPGEVDLFLSPLASARRGHEEISTRPYAATLDSHGELVNEGIVVALPFIEELELELDIARLSTATVDNVRWAFLPVDPDLPDSLYVGLRYLGVARLKGLPPQELAEAVVWTELPQNAEEIDFKRSMIGLLRQLTQTEDFRHEAAPEEDGTIGTNLLVITYLLEDGARKWIFGEYRDTDDVLLHSIQVPIQTPELKPGEPMEMWLFRNRFELARVYEGLRRENPGIAVPLPTLRGRAGYLACFLAAPHRAVE
jgi:class 3 adenylate cyclase